jgi:hypothetical protein
MEEALLRRLTRIRDELDAIITTAAREVPDTAWHRWFKRAGGVLNHVDQAGGEVRPEVWRAIGDHYGYDPRGMAGFYSGHDPSMRRDRATNMRILTDRGRIEAQNWRRLFQDQLAEAAA